MELLSNLPMMVYMVPRNGEPAKVAACCVLVSSASCAPLHVCGGACVAIVRAEPSEKRPSALCSGLCRRAESASGFYQLLLQLLQCMRSTDVALRAAVPGLLQVHTAENAFLIHHANAFEEGDETIVLSSGWVRPSWRLGYTVTSGQAHACYQSRVYFTPVMLWVQVHGFSGEAGRVACVCLS